MNETTKDQEQKARRFVAFCVGRFHKKRADSDIATDMGFQSAEVLYKQLESDGSPVCGVCGLLYPEPDHREEHKGKRRKRQPGVGGGHRVKLPDVAAARGLFRAALKELDLYIALAEIEESWLEGNIEEGEFRGKRFITHSVDRDALEIAWRQAFTAEEWRELCEQYGGDPESDQVVLSRGTATPGGVTRTPSFFLAALIAAYALATPLNTSITSALPLKPLVDSLHHEPDSAAWEEIADNIEDLRKVAGHLAARVRGAKVESGTGITEVPRQKHFVAWLIRALEKEGVSSDEDVLEELKSLLSLTDELTVKDIDRIRRMRLEPPE